MTISAFTIKPKLNFKRLKLVVGDGEFRDRLFCSNLEIFLDTNSGKKIFSPSTKEFSIEMVSDLRVILLWEMRESLLGIYSISAPIIVETIKFRSCRVPIKFSLTRSWLHLNLSISQSNLILQMIFVYVECRLYPVDYYSHVWEQFKRLGLNWSCLIQVSFCSVIPIKIILFSLSHLICCYSMLWIFRLYLDTMLLCYDVAN